MKNRAGRPLKRMFDSVPERYDLLNRLLTFRLDETWRKRAAGEILHPRPRRVLDIGCGTGDLALRLADMTDNEILTTGVDFSEPMLNVAKLKTAERGRVCYVCADASLMPFPDQCFDALGFAFSFRNLAWRNPLKDMCLVEIWRILKPGGKCVILETSQPRSPLLKACFHAYLRVIVTGVGGLLSGREGAYRYLAESARFFYKPEEISAMLVEAGFQNARYKLLLGGVAALHVAEKQWDTA